MRTRMPALRCSLLLAIVSGTGACDSSGNGSGAPITILLVGVPDLDATLRGGSSGDNLGLFVGNFGFVGAPGQEERAIATFDVSPLPAGARVTSAVVTLFQETVTATDPYPPRGPVLLDHVNLMGALDGGDFDSGLLTANLGILSSDATLGPKTLEVGAAVQADLDANRTVSSFRLHFQTVVESGSIATRASETQRGATAGGPRPCSSSTCPEIRTEGHGDSCVSAPGNTATVAERRADPRKRVTQG